MRNVSKSIGFVAVLVSILVVLTGGCADLIANLIEERSGNVTVVFINNTPYRAAFTFGTYDALDRDLPYGEVDLLQRRLEAMTSTASITLSCRRNLAIGTEEFVQRARDTEANLVPQFDDDAFDTVVHFSDAPIDSDAAALPTVGTAEGREVRLGVDYACGDELIFTLVEDASAPGGFAIEFRLLHSEDGS
jgi:hypothetical protein